MSKKRVTSRCLVVDASVAHSAGSLDSKHPTGILCRDFLLAVKSVCHRIAWNDMIKKEWEEHESSFARQWRVSMLNLDKIRILNRAGELRIQEAVEEHCDDASIRAIMLKDCHLIDAALETDDRISSLDERVRGHFGDHAPAIELLRPIQWVNPAVIEERAVEWLENGAPAENKRRLRKR